jgi:hypothetical protein
VGRAGLPRSPDLRHLCRLLKRQQPETSDFCVEAAFSEQPANPRAAR